MPTNVLVLGENTFSFHRFSRIRQVFETALEAADIAVDTTTNRDAYFELHDYDVVLDYTTDNDISSDRIEALLAFVDDGGGYVGLHCAADLTTTSEGNRDQPAPRKRSMIGGHFVGHPDRTQLRVVVVDSYHPITAGLSTFRIWDEPYKLVYDEDVTVLARMDHPELGDMPTLWVRSHGDGRVCYCSLGHGPHALTAQPLQSLLRRAVRWAGE